jgi:hypothetical protein
MNIEAFRGTLGDPQPPDLTTPLRALWWDAKADWNRAHEAAQEGDDAEGAWVHAYLHRKEGDLSNARYWYARAGRGMPAGSLDEEWTDVVRVLLGGSGTASRPP